MDSDAAFSRIQAALEDFNADVGKATAQQAATKDTIAAIEYEMEQLRQLISDNRMVA
jgi:hypothetical protein